MTSSFRHQLISEVGGGAPGSWLEPAGNVELVILFGDLHTYMCAENSLQEIFLKTRDINFLLHQPP